MKYIILQALSLFVSFSSFAQKQLVVDPDAEPRELSGSFSSIRVSGGIHLYLSQSDNEALAISAPDEKYKEGIKTEVENGELRIYYSGEKFHFGNNLRLNVYLAYKSVQQIMTSGASDITIAGVMDVPSLNLHLSGASDMKGEIRTKELNIKLTGASDLSLSGSAETVNLENNGASDFKSYGLTTDILNVKSSGASDVRITVNKEIYANVSGASSIHYKGNAEIKQRKESGASSIARAD